MGRIRPNKIPYRSTKATHLIEVLQELYICDRQCNHHQQKSGCEQLQRPGSQTNCVSSTKTLVALLGQRDTALAPRTIHDVCRRRQSAQFQQHLSEPGPLVEVDLDYFKCHGLGASSSDDDLSADGPHPVRKF